MPEENTQVQTPELTPEEVQAKIKDIQTAVATFTADPQHDRYKLCAENRSAIDGYLQEHLLETTADSLHLAFTELSKAGKLDLFEASKLQPPKEKVEERKPASTGKESDLSLSLAEQQKARKTTAVPGVTPSNNRAAFIRAAETAANQKIRGGRFHL